MTLLIIRGCFLCLCMLGSWAISQLHERWAVHPLLALGIGLASGGAVIGLDLYLKGFSLRGLSSATFGLFIGFLASYFIGNSVLFSFIEPQTRLVGQIALYVIVSYLGMVISLRGSEEFSLVIPYVRFRREDRPERLVLLDTNIIIDGRILDVCATGFLNAILIVPRFVLHELQYIADADDDTRRARGKRGLEVLKSLQKNPLVEIKIHDEEVAAVKEVDAKLVRLAKMLHAEIATNDANLQHIAELEHVTVLNFNDLAKALRPVVLPGETLVVKLVKEGRESDQAVAYLDDGTMIVVNRARRLLGRDAEVVIGSVMQTSAGRMAFAELANAPAASAAKPVPDLAPVK